MLNVKDVGVVFYLYEAVFFVKMVFSITWSLHAGLV